MIDKLDRIIDIVMIVSFCIYGFYHAISALLRKFNKKASLAYGVVLLLYLFLEIVIDAYRKDLNSVVFNIIWAVFALNYCKYIICELKNNKKTGVPEDK